MNLSNGVNPADDTIHDPVDVANWSESFAMWAWGNEDDVGVFTHYQRHPQDRTLWRAFCLVFVSDQIYAHHSYGRELPNKQGPGFASCHIAIEEPQKCWRLKVDAAGIHTNAAALQQAPITDGPAVPIKVDIALEMRTKVWSLAKLSKVEGISAEVMGAHLEQKGRCTGSITVGDKSYAVNCLGGNDHSYGPRDFDKLRSGGYLTAVFEDGRSFCAISMSATEHVGYLDIGDGEFLPVTNVVLPQIPWEAGAKGVLRIEAGQVSTEVNVEITERRGFFTLVRPNFEHIGYLNGAATDRYYADLACKLEWDGVKGAGSWEPCCIVR